MPTTRRSPVRTRAFASAVLTGAVVGACALAGPTGVAAAAGPREHQLDNGFGVPTTGGAFAAPASEVPAEAMNMNLQLGPYIKGTLSEVRDQIDGPLEMLMAKKADRTAKRDGLKADEAERSAKVVADLRTSSDAFRQTDDELVAARKAVADARASGDGSAVIAATARVAKAQEAERAQVDAVLAKDPDVVANRQEIAKLNDQLAALTDPIAKATKGREQMLDGLRTTSALPGPPNDGAKGMLMKLKVTKVVDAHSLVGEYVAVEKVAEDTKAARPDGMKAFSGRGYKVNLLVTGINTADIKEKTTVDLDQTFKLNGKKTVGKTTCLVAEKQPMEGVDAFFAVVDPLKLPEGADKTAAK